MKINKNTTIGLIVIVCLIIGASWAIISIGNSTNKGQTNQVIEDKFISQYPKVTSGHKFVYAEPAEILDIIDGGDGVVFLGFPECPWCQQLAPIIQEAAQSENIDKIYYLNIKESRANNDEVYQKLVTKLQDYLPKDDDGNPRISVPDVTAYRGGQIVGRFEQEATNDGEQVTPDTYWTSERKDRAVEQLREMMARVSEFAVIQSKIKDGAQLLDVRTAEEFDSGHFAGAINLDVEDIIAGKLPDAAKDTQLYVYCRSGNRSAQAVSLLKQAGFTNITDLGGLTDVESIGGTLTNRY